MKINPPKEGFTIIPKTSENRGLNFIDKSAEDYMAEILKYKDILKKCQGI